MTEDLQAFCASRGWEMPRRLSAAQTKRAVELGLTIIDDAPRNNADWSDKEDADLLCAAVDGVSTYDLALRHRRTMQSVRHRLRVVRARAEPSGATT